MYKALIARSARTLIQIGRSVLASLRKDPRMTEAVTALEAAQSILEMKVSTWEASSETVTSKVKERAEAYRALSNSLHDFQSFLLSLAETRHTFDHYVRYFSGEGVADTLSPADMVAAARHHLGSLEGECSPEIAAWKGTLTAALISTANSEQALATAIEARAERFGPMQEERKEWTAGLSRARGLAETASGRDRMLVRRLFAPAADSKGARGSGAQGGWSEAEPR